MEPRYDEESTDLPQLSSSSQHTVKKTVMVYAVILGITVFLYLLYRLNTVVLQLLVALIVAVALEPLVQFLMRRGIARVWAILAAVLSALVIVLVIIGAIATPLVTEGAKLATNTGAIIEGITANTSLRTLNERFHVIDGLKQVSGQAASKLASNGGPIIGVFGSIIGGVSAMSIILVFSFFLLWEGPAVWERLLALARPGHAMRIRRTAQKMSQAVGGFVSGNLFISLIAGAVTLVTLLLLEVPYAFALAALVALFDLIPLVGASLATILVALVALTKGVVAMLVVVVVLMVYQLVEGHIIQPIVYSRAIALSPLLVILATVIGAELGGIIGVLLAIPVAAVLQIVVLELVTGGREMVHPNKDR